MTKELTWLTVGGAPRSGTTALGEALNKSAHIALFHEFQSAVFFDAINLLFVEEERLSKYSDFNLYEKSVPVKERDVTKIVSTIFSVVFKKNASVVGTKFPGAQAWRQPTIPDSIIEKYITLCRNPFDCVLSAVLKDKAEGQLCDQNYNERLLYWWLSSWNHAVEHNLDGNFFHLFHEGLGEDNASTAQNIATFLGIPCDFDLTGMVSRIHTYPDLLDRYNEAGIGYLIPFINRLFPYDQWLSLANKRMEQKKLCGYVLPIGKTIRLTTDGDGWKYLYSGFYPPEFDGTWTDGNVQKVLFTPDRHVYGSVCVTIAVIFAVVPPPVVSIFLDERLLVSIPMELPENGLGMQCSFRIENFESIDSETMILKFCIDTSVNPKQLGLSDDDRNLGIMISSIRIDCNKDRI